MSQLTANSVWPVISALPEQEQQRLLQQLQKRLQTPPTATVAKKKTVNDRVVEQLGEKFKKGNAALLAADIMANY